MRMILPPLKDRRVIGRQLVSFFRVHKVAEFNRAIGEICRFYRLKRPQVEWFEYLDWGRTAGRTYENGKIHLVHPENWKKGRKYNSERQWVNMVFHEMGHYIFWADAERKADTFALRMEQNTINGNGFHAVLSSNGKSNGRNGNGRHVNNGRHKARGRSA